ncbi:MAG TPA: pyridoxal-phosphate dependent enzyme [Polyangiaceae bacterium]|nr:pyridoxal-phosphate dependent enzyme [Polyangiaceae bacterium]
MAYPLRLIEGRGPADAELAARFYGSPESSPWPAETGTIVDRIGNTPLQRLRRVGDGLPERVELYAKLEMYNPGGSVKDRPAAMMVYEGLRSGALRPGKTILESTSGNTGVALATLGAALGYPVRLCLSAGVTEERKRLLNALGAEQVFTDPALGSDGAIAEAEALYAADPDRYFKTDQYNNPANVLAHYHTTAPEIWHQTQGRVTHVVAAIGTSGTVMGTGWGLRARRPDVQVVAVEPDRGDHGLVGMRHIPSTRRPGIYRKEGFDQLLRVSTEEGHAAAHAVARREGILVGSTAGAVLAAALRVARSCTAAVVVCIFSDSGERYLSSALWSREPS